MNNMSFKLPCKVYYYCYIILIFLINFKRNADIYIYFTPVKHVYILKRVFLNRKEKAMFNVIVSDITKFSLCIGWEK